MFLIKVFQWVCDKLDRPDSLSNDLVRLRAEREQRLKEYDAMKRQEQLNEEDLHRTG